MKRHGLSLQRHKRQDKVPLDEVHRLANSFYTYNRRASLWSIKRGPMGAFTFEDICNMDETPLALFGDQAKQCVNDIGTNNEINGYISNKRFCTVLLTVFGKNQRMKPTIVFKSKGNIILAERQQYSKDVHVIFTPKAVINGPSIETYTKYWLAKVHDGHPKLLIVDSANSHLKPEVIHRLRKKKCCGVYNSKWMYTTFAKYIDRYTSRSNIKLTSKQQRILCTRLVATAWSRTQATIDLERAFLDIGYTWVDDSPVSIRTLSGFVFDSSTITSMIVNYDNGDDGGEKECEKNKNSHLSSITTTKKMKQLNLDHFIKK
ncbi:unnamed protein product [Rotaria magnacalcarata]